MSWALVVIISFFCCIVAYCLYGTSLGRKMFGNSDTKAASDSQLDDDQEFIIQEDEDE